MVYYLIICRSLTYAQRTAQVLERVGIPGWVQRSPKLISKEGCGYCVRIPERRLADALTVLRREGMSPKQVFLQTAEGEYSEVHSGVIWTVPPPRWKNLGQSPGPAHGP